MQLQLSYGAGMAFGSSRRRPEKNSPKHQTPNTKYQIPMSNALRAVELFDLVEIGFAIFTTVFRFYWHKPHLSHRAG